LVTVRAIDAAVRRLDANGGIIRLRDGHAASLVAACGAHRRSDPASRDRRCGARGRAARRGAAVRYHDVMRMAMSAFDALDVERPHRAL
jgi:hypothetical protein